jgi:hypothetical protein
MNPAPAARNRGLRSIHRFLCLFRPGLLLAIAGFAVAPFAQAAPEKRPVYVTASFTDKNDLFIENLQQSEIEIFENNQPRKIEFMARDELPTVYGIVFDRGMLPESSDQDRPSGQAVPKSIAARDLAYQLIDKQLGRQTLWVGVYDRELETVFEPASDGFGAKNALHELRGSRRHENTFLYSALFSATTMMNQRHEKRRILILFLESLDSETAGKMKQLKNLLSSSNVELFAVCFASRLADAGTMPSSLTVSLMKELTQVTAGSAFFTMDYRDHFDDIARRVINHLRTVYTFGFTSDSTTASPGKFVIKCSRPNSKVKSHPAVPVLD